MYFHVIKGSARWFSILQKGMYICCGVELDLTTWRDHINEFHDHSEVLQCMACSQILPVPFLRVHIDEDHSISCPEFGCDFKTFTFEDAEAHMQLHEQEDHPASAATSLLPSAVSPPCTSDDQGRPRNQSVEAALAVQRSRQIASIFSMSLSGVRRLYVARHITLHQIEPADRGYGCGYRNLQTLIASIMYDSNLRSISHLESVPSIRAIQSGIEAAWRSDFDPVGAEQLGRQLIGSRKWIGATEVASYLQYHNIRVEVLDLTIQPRNRVAMQNRMVEWVLHYFATAATSYPLYLQQPRHSFTIIGAEENARGNFLLVYDPSVSVNQVQEALTRRSFDDLLFLRKSSAFFNRSAYQIVAIHGALSPESYELSKHFTGYNHTVLIP